MISPITIGIMVTVALLAGVLAVVFRDNASSSTADRLDILVGKRRNDSSPDLLKETAFGGDHKALLAKLAARVPNLQKLFEQADCHIKPNTLVLLGAVFGGVGIAGSWLARVPPFFVPLPGLVLFFIPFGWLWNKRRARLNKFAAQLPDALELIARALRAGHALGPGMHLVAEEMPMPIAAEFGRVYEEQNLGIPLDEALRGMCERVPNLDVRFFVTSVSIQRQTGGDLVEILDKISYVIRERYRILGQVKALTGEGRLSGVVLVALPFVLFLTMLHLKPDYVKTLWESPQGIKMSVVALVMQVIGAAVIKKIVDIKV